MDFTEKNHNNYEVNICIYYGYRYNKKFANDGIHEGLLWTEINDEIEAFKDDFIFPEMIEGEKEYSMFEWLKVLPQHSFTQRHFENTFVEKSPMEKAHSKLTMSRKENDSNVNDDCKEALEKIKE